MNKTQTKNLLSRGRYGGSYLSKNEQSDAARNCRCLEININISHEKCDIRQIIFIANALILDT